MTERSGVTVNCIALLCVENPEPPWGGGLSAGKYQGVDRLAIPATDARSIAGNVTGIYSPTEAA